MKFHRHLHLLYLAGFLSTLFSPMVLMSQSDAYRPEHSFPMNRTSGLTSTESGLTWEHDIPVEFGKGDAGGLLFSPANSPALKAGWSTKKQFTLEAWILIDFQPDQQKYSLFYLSDRSFITDFYVNGLEFKTQTRTSSGELVKDNWFIPFEGESIHSLKYFLDGRYHHFVWKFDAVTGRKEIWIDGLTDSKYTRSVQAKGLLCKFPPDCQKYLGFNNPQGEALFCGQLKQVLVYSDFIPSSVHIQNSRKMVSQPADALSEAIPPPLSPRSLSSSSVDPAEYPPGHPNVSVEMFDQLRSFPDPGYKDGHGLMPNVNWVNPLFFGGARIEGRSMEKITSEADRIQLELAQNWNYYLMVPSTFASQSNPDKYQPKAFQSSAIQLANRYPELPAAMITFWGQARPEDVGDAGTRPNVTDQNMAPTFYLRDNREKFIFSQRGNNRKILSPAVPMDYASVDGRATRLYIQNTLSQLTRPIQLINENGEMPFSMISDEVLASDPAVVRDRQRMGVATWETYLARAKTRQRLAYANEFMSLPALSNTIFSWYKVDGGPTKFHFLWDESRKVGSKINGQYYATPNFYVRWPDKWKTGAGAWMAWDWIETSRKREIMAGDRLFSPYIAAGWDADPEKNVRPTQWLGLLKCLNVVGAEFYYTCFFNIGVGEDITADPRNYIWQLATPSYAQGVASYFEEFLRDGDLLTDESGIPIISHPVSDPRVLMTIRKRTGKKQYLVGLTLQPSSNVMGNIEDAVPVTVSLEEQDYTLTCRAQGSVYTLDLTDPTHPVIVQLDSWHEKGHPLNWRNVRTFEAEMASISGAFRITTESGLANPSALEYSEFTTYVQSRGGTCILRLPAYLWQGSQGSIRVRIRNTSGNANLSLRLDDRVVKTKNCIRNRDWVWIDLGKLSEATYSPASVLTLVWDDQELQIDQIEVSQE